MTPALRLCIEGSPSLAAYLVDAVRATEVFAFSPGPLPLESDGYHPTPRGCELWVGTIVETLWS